MEQQPDILCVRLVERNTDLSAFKTVFQLGPYPGWTLALAELAPHLAQAAAQVIYNNPQTRQWQVMAQSKGKQMWVDWEFKHIVQLARDQNIAIQESMHQPSNPAPANDGGVLP